jgi:hypothetical protein
MPGPYLLEAGAITPLLATQYRPGIPDIGGASFRST